MKVLALNGSPHAENGQTASIMAPFLKGMEEAGADVELFYVYKLDIKPCLGCHSCWGRTPGECVQKDDMEVLRPRLAAADVLVLGTPVYVDGMTGAMKTMIDRLLPLGEGSVEIRQGRCRHPVRERVQSGKVVLVSTCGYPEIVTFDPLIVHVRAICGNFDREFAGALLRPHSHLLEGLKDRGVPVDDVYEAAREAGRDLVYKGQISAQILARVSREFIAQAEYVGGA
jgi:multimeric flavodoxin WrbA